MSPAFTPGPWFWAMDSRNQPTALMRSGTGDYVITPQADVGDYGLSVDPWNDVSEADAALIATAPDLLAAAVQALWHIGTDDDRLAMAAADKWETSAVEAADRLRAAITKATGADQ